MAKLMRFLWVDAGNDPNFDKGDKLLGGPITGYFMALWDPYTTPEKLVEIRSRGKVAGLYVGSGVNHWSQTEGKSGKECAQVAVVEYRRLRSAMNAIKMGLGDDLRIQYNDETKDAKRITELLTESRKLLPKVGTSWTLEGKQAGWFNGPMISAILKTKTRVVPQMYDGDMTVVYPLKPEIDKWIAYGIPATQVSPIWDAEKLAINSSGYLFTQGRLP